MPKIFGAPSRYLQGPGLIEEIGSHAKSLGSRAVLITDRIVADIIGEKMQRSCKQAEVSIEILCFEDELTPAKVEKLSIKAKQFKPDIIIAGGGGKAIDAGKAVCHHLKTRLITVPTAASTDAPTSKNYVLYDDAHQIALVGHLPTNPDIVLVDTTILAHAPVDLLRFGIGDSISKKFEARQCFRANGTNMFGGHPTRAGLAIADACFKILQEDAETALATAGTGIVTPEFDRVTEAVILLSGLGFESGGLSLAHALTRGFSILPGAMSAPHGYQVAVGLLVQLSLETGSEQEHKEIWDLYVALKLPRTLADLGCTHQDNQTLGEVASRTLAAPHAANFERKLTLDELIAALLNPAPKH